VFLRLKCLANKPSLWIGEGAMNTLSKVKEGDVEIRDIYDYIVGYELN
jgi:hypothetical protein